MEKIMKRKIAIYSAVCFTFFANVTSGMQTDINKQPESRKSITENLSVASSVQTDINKRPKSCKSIAEMFAAAKGDRTPLKPIKYTPEMRDQVTRAIFEKPPFMSNKRYTVNPNCNIYAQCLGAQNQKKRSNPQQHAPIRIADKKYKTFSEQFADVLRIIEEERSINSSSRQETNSSPKINSGKESASTSQTPSQPPQKSPIN